MTAIVLLRLIDEARTWFVGKIPKSNDWEARQARAQMRIGYQFARHVMHTKWRQMINYNHAREIVITTILGNMAIVAARLFRLRTLPAVTTFVFWPNRQMTISTNSVSNDPAALAEWFTALATEYMRIAWKERAPMVETADPLAPRMKQSKSAVPVAAKEKTKGEA